MTIRDEGGETNAVLADNEFGAGRRAAPAPVVRPRGGRAHKAKDPAKECLKDRLQETMVTLARLASEKSTGADIRADLKRLDARTFCERLVQSSGREARRVSPVDIDRMAEVLGWVEAFIDDKGVQWLVFEWASGTKTTAMDQASRATLWRIIDRALDKMLCGLEATNHKGLETMKRFGL